MFDPAPCERDGQSGGARGMSRIGHAQFIVVLRRDLEAEGRPAFPVGALLVVDIAFADVGLEVRRLGPAAFELRGLVVENQPCWGGGWWLFGCFRRDDLRGGRRRELQSLSLGEQARP